MGRRVFSAQASKLGGAKRFLHWMLPVLVLLATGRSWAANERDLDFDWIMGNVDKLLKSFIPTVVLNLSANDGDGNGQFDDDTLAAFSVIMRNNVSTFNRPGSFNINDGTLMRADFPTNRTLADEDMAVHGFLDLTCTILKGAGVLHINGGNLPDCKLTTMLKADEALGIPMGKFIGDILLDLFAGLIEVGDWPAMPNYINTVITTLVHELLVAAGQTSLEGNLSELQLNDNSVTNHGQNNYCHWGATPGGPTSDPTRFNVFGAAGYIGGQDLITNGSVVGSTGWTLGTGWTVPAGNNLTGATTSAAATQTVNVVSGNSYQLIYTVTRTAGSVQLKVGTVNGTSRSAAGTYFETITANTTGAVTFAVQGTGFSGTVDKIRLVQATPSNATLYAAAAGNRETFLQSNGLGVYSSQTTDQPIHFGPEAVVNGTFTGGTSWTLGSGWTAPGTNLTGTATTSTASQSIPVTLGKYYTVRYTVATLTAGSVRVKLGTSVGATRTATGTYSQVLQAAGNTTLAVEGVTAYSGTIDNVTVRETLPTDVFTAGTSLTITPGFVNSNAPSNTYKWEDAKDFGNKNSSSANSAYGLVDITNGGSYSGATTTTLTITDLSYASHEGIRPWLRASDQVASYNDIPNAGMNTSTGVATAGANPTGSPEIDGRGGRTSSYAGIHVVETLPRGPISQCGGTVTLTAYASAVDDGPDADTDEDAPTYQWQYGATLGTLADISGQTANTYTFTGDPLANGYYVCNTTVYINGAFKTTPTNVVYFNNPVAQATVPSTPDMATASDSGSSSTDNYTNVTTPTFTGTTSAAATVTLVVDGVNNNTTVADASGNWSIAPTALSDGPHTIAAFASNCVGTSATSSALNVTIDTAAPAAPGAPDLVAGSDSGSSNTDNITNDNTPDFTGSAENGATVKVFAGATQIATGTAGPSYTLTSSALADATYAITATATDLAGNVSAASSSLSVTIDTAAPATPSTPDLSSASDSGSSSTDNITNISPASFTGTAEAGVTVTLFSGASAIGSATATGGNWTISGALSAGAQTITAKATDAAGNTSGSSGGLSVTLDQSAPAQPGTPDLVTGSDSGSSSTDNVTNDTTPDFTGSAEAGSTVTVFAGASLVGSGTATGGTYTITTSALADGTYLITVKATDAAGNVSVSSSSLSVTIDATAPAAPSAPDMTAGTDSGTSNTDNITNVTTPTFTGTAEAGVTVKLLSGLTLLGSGTATGGNYSITSSALADSTQTLTATATDLAGNVSGSSGGLSVTIDTAAPLSPSTPDLAAASDSGTSNTDNITNVTTPTFNGTAEVGVTVTVLVDGVAKGSGTATAGNYSIGVSPALAEGARSITATASDTAGNTSAASSALSVTIDTTAPAQPGLPDLASGSDSGTSNTDNITNDPTPALSGTAEAGAVVTVSSDKDGVLGTPTATGGTWNLTTGLTENVHAITATAKDAAGNTSVASTTLTVTVDRTAPAAPGTPDLIAGSDAGASSTDNITNVTTPTFTGSAITGNNVKIFAGATQVGSGNATVGAYTIAVSALSEGSPVITATQTDTAGNTSVASTGLAITVDTTAPTITAVSPANGSTFSSLPNVQVTTSEALSGLTAGALTVNSSAATLLSGTNPYTFTGYTNPADGTVNFVLTVTGITDTAGNALSATGNTWSGTLNSTVPGVTITNGTIANGAVTNSAAGTTFTATFTENVNTGVQSATNFAIGDITVTNGFASAFAVQTANSVFTFTVTPSGAGVISVSINASVCTASSAPAGRSNTASNTYSYTLDQTAPTITVNPLTTNVNRPGLSGTVNDNGATITVQIGAQNVSAINNGDGTWTLAPGVLTTLADGTYSVLARATDTAGNIGTDGTSNELKIDTVAPTVTVASLNTNNNRPALSGTVNDTNATVSVQVGAQTVPATVVGTTWSVAANVLTALPDATYDVIVTATDVAGNVGTDATTNDLVVDTTAPVVTVDTLTTNDNRPALSGTVNDNTATISVQVGAQTVAGTNNGDGTWSLADDALAVLADGTYDVQVTATDTFSNAGTDASTNELTIDATAPAVTVNTQNTNNNRPGLGGTVDDNAATISVTVDAQTLPAVNNGNGTWSLAASTLTALADGTYDVQVTATDVLGNAGTDATTDELTIDATAPVVTVTVTVTADTTPALGGSVDDPAATISVTVNSQTLAAVNNGDGTWSLADNALSALAEGVYNVSVTATDSFSNVGTDASAGELTVDLTGPVISLDGATTVTVDCGEGYTEAGFTAVDSRQGDVSGDVVITDNVTALTPPGTYHIKYNVSDSVGNAAAQVQRTVTVLNNCPLAVDVNDLAPLANTGSQYTFSAIALNAIGTVSYQWQRELGLNNWVNLGIGGSSYTIQGLVVGDSGTYRCEATDAVTTAYSADVILTVEEGVPVAGLAGLSLVTVVTALAGAARLRRKR